MIDRILRSPSAPSGEPGTVLLETTRLVMRRYLMTDAPALAAAADHTEVTLNMRDRFPSPYTLADAEAFLASHDNPDMVSYPARVGIWIKPDTVDNPSSEPVYIGAVGILPQGDINYRTWELGYWLTPSAWGKGFMSEAVRAFLSWCFETWPTLYRIEASCYSRNKESAGVLKKCGFLEEGTKRGSAEKRGEILSETFFGITRDDLKQS